MISPFEVEKRGENKEFLPITPADIYSLVAKTFFRLTQGGEIHLTVPSKALVKRGLVSEKTARTISRRTALAVGKIGQPAVNEILIKPTEEKDGYEIMETYVAEEEAVRGGRLDQFVEELMVLREKPSKEITISLRGRISDLRLRGIAGRDWKPEKELGEGFKTLKITQKHIQTTYALIDEAIKGMATIHNP